jgi:hypothetical protein
MANLNRKGAKAQRARKELRGMQMKSNARMVGAPERVPLRSFAPLRLCGEVLL